MPLVFAVLSPVWAMWGYTEMRRRKGSAGGADSPPVHAAAPTDPEPGANA